MRCKKANPTGEEDWKEQPQTCLNLQIDFPRATFVLLHDDLSLLSIALYHFIDLLLFRTDDSDSKHPGSATTMALDGTAQSTHTHTVNDGDGDSDNDVRFRLFPARKLDYLLQNHAQTWRTYEAEADESARRQDSGKPSWGKEIYQTASAWAERFQKVWREVGIGVTSLSTGTLTPSQHLHTVPPRNASRCRPST